MLKGHPHSGGANEQFKISFQKQKISAGTGVTEHNAAYISYFVAGCNTAYFLYFVAACNTERLTLPSGS